MKRLCNLILLLILLFATAPLAAEKMTDTAKTVLAGGCFWCMEADFEKLDGVVAVISGFTGGEVENPTYKGNHAGHYEAVEITYDTSKLSYLDILNYYWVNIDPFDDDGQFCDKGHSYRAAIFVANEKERKIAVETKRAVEKEFPEQKIVTKILDASTFWPIKGNESYHQDYYKNNPLRYKFYRFNCGRDARLKEIWGERATH